MEKSNLQILTNGIIKENPVLVLVLGTCPTLAVTTMAKNAIGMGLAATFVLLGSNIVISPVKESNSGQSPYPLLHCCNRRLCNPAERSASGVCAGCLQRTGYLPAADRCKLYHILARAEMFAEAKTACSNLLWTVSVWVLVLPSLC